MRKNAGMLLAAGMIMAVFTSCWSTRTVRDMVPQAAVGIQRVRVETDHEINDMPMQIFIDNDEPFELANGESTTILLNNGDHVAYAVIDNIESDTISFKTSYKTMIIAITSERNMFGNISLKIEAYEYK